MSTQDNEAVKADKPAEGGRLYHFPTDYEGPEQGDVANQSEHPSSQLSRTIEGLGRKFTRNPNASIYSIRRRGAAVIAAGALLVTGAFIHNYEAGSEYTGNSDIPTTTSDLDPHKYKLVTVPNGGAMSVASEFDSDHDPRQGVDRMAEQLGHQPVWGDQVAVPTDEHK